MKNRALIVISVVVLAFVGLGAFLFWSARTPPTISHEIDFHKESPQEQERRRADADKLVKQVEEVAQAAKRKEKKKFRIQASEEQLNTLLQDRIDTSKFPIRNLRLGLSPGEIAAQGQGSYSGIEAVVTVKGTVEVENGVLKYKVNSINLGGIPTTKFKDKIETEVSKMLNRGLEHAPGKIEKVTIEDGRMIVEGTTD